MKEVEIMYKRAVKRAFHWKASLKCAEAVDETAFQALISNFSAYKIRNARLMASIQLYLDVLSQEN